MRTLWKLAAALGLLTASSAWAAEYYPAQISTRAFGTDQGDVGDCETAAEVGALESAFANRGYSFVKLSLFYRHAANWAGHPKDEVTKLDLDAADLAFIQKAGPLLPDYMWPEDGVGYDPSRTGIRPHPAQAVVWDPEFPSAPGFTKEHFTFAPNYSNTRNLDALKAAVTGGNAVTLSLHGDLLQSGDPNFLWDHVTGFLTTRYAWANLAARLQAKKLDAKTGINHSVWVVGFDDSLYADQGYAVPGALIVRNSWNDAEKVEAALRKPNEYQQIALARMRLKIYSRNLPGFYAIPYQYVLDSIANQAGGFKVLNLNYAAFASKYRELSSRYRVARLPYVCELVLSPTRRLTDGVKRELKKFGTAFAALNNPGLDDKTRANATQVTYQMALREVKHRTLSHDGSKAPLFRYARLSSHLGSREDRADAFYAGHFADYYCPSMNGIWPDASALQQPEMREALFGLGEGGSTFQNWYQYLRVLSGSLQ